MRRLVAVVAFLAISAGATALAYDVWHNDQNASNFKLYSLPAPDRGSAAVRLQDVAVGACIPKWSGVNGTAACATVNVDYLTSSFTLGGDLSGTPASANVIKLLETGGPTHLAIGAIADGALTKRNGATFVGATPGVDYLLPNVTSPGNYDRVSVAASGLVTGGATMIVANVAALEAVAGANYRDGSRVYVQSVFSDFVFHAVSTQTVDHIMIASVSGMANARWLRAPPSDGTQWNQLSWFIDTGAGSDENDCVSSGTACKTFAEVRRRLLSRYTPIGATNGLTVTVTGDLGDTDPIAIEMQPDARNLAVNVVVIGVPTVTSLGTIASVTAHSYSTNQADEITITGLDWTPYVGKIIRRVGTTGTTGQTSVVVAAVSSGVARVTPVNVFSAAGTAWSAAQQVEVLTLPKAVGAKANFPGGMQIEYFDFNPATGVTFQTISTGNLILSASTVLGTAGGAFRDVGSGIQLAGCALSTRTFSAIGQFGADRSLLLNATVTVSNSRTGRNEWQDSILGTSNITLGEGVYTRFHSLGIYGLAAAATGVTFSSHANAEFTDFVYGTGNNATARVFSLLDDNTIALASGSASIVADPGILANIAGVNVAPGTLPYYRDQYGNSITGAQSTDLPAHVAITGSDLTGFYPNTSVTGIRESSGPTHLPIGAITSGQFLRDVSGSIVGTTTIPGASVGLTATEVGFGSGSNTLTGSTQFLYTDSFTTANVTPAITLGDGSTTTSANIIFNQASGIVAQSLRWRQAGTTYSQFGVTRDGTATTGRVTSGVSITPVSGGSGNDYFEVRQTASGSAQFRVWVQNGDVAAAGLGSSGGDEIGGAATNGFLFIPRSSGAMTGVPALVGGDDGVSSGLRQRAAMAFDRANNRLYLYDATEPAWHYAEVSDGVASSTTLAAGQVGFGSASNLLTGNGQLKFDTTTFGSTLPQFIVGDGTTSTNGHIILANTGTLANRIRFANGGTAVGNVFAEVNVSKDAAAGTGRIVYQHNLVPVAGGSGNDYFSVHQNATVNNPLHVYVSKYDVAVGSPVSLATGATNGFLYLPRVAGAPTGVPDRLGIAGETIDRYPVVIDSTNKRWYYYDGAGAAWHYVKFDDGGSAITALTGDVTATGPGSVAATLSTTGVSAGSYTYASLTVDAKGRLTAASNGSLAAIATSGSASDLIAGTVPAGRFPALTGDITTPGGSLATTLKNTGAGAGSCTYCSVTFDGQGRETAYSSGATPVLPSRTISTTAPLTGGGDLSANRTLGLTTPSGSRVIAGNGTDFISDDEIRLDNIVTDSLMASQDGAVIWRNLSGSTMLGASNFEQVRSFWSANVWNLKSEKAGTGTLRAINISSEKGVNVDTNLEVNGPTAPSNVSFIVGHSTNSDRDHVQFFLGGGGQFDSTNSFVDINIHDTAITGANGIWATERVRPYVITAASGSPTVTEAVGMYVEGPTLSGVGVPAGGGPYDIHGPGKSRFANLVVDQLGSGTGIEQVVTADSAGNLGTAGNAPVQTLTFRYNNQAINLLSDRRRVILPTNGGFGNADTLVASAGTDPKVTLAANWFGTGFTYPIPNKQYKNLSCWVDVGYAIGSGSGAGTIQFAVYEVVTDPTSSTNYTAHVSATISVNTTGASHFQGANMGTSAGLGSVASLAFAVYRTDTNAGFTVDSLSFGAVCNVW